MPLKAWRVKMATASYATKTKKDGWTVVTADRKLSAQWEHTILVTETGYEVLTLREEEAA